MAHLDSDKPVYVFILKTAESNLDTTNEEALQDTLRNKKILKKYKTDDPTTPLDNHCSFAISGSSLPLGCWTSPKFATCIAKGEFTILLYQYTFLK